VVVQVRERVHIDDYFCKQKVAQLISDNLKSIKKSYSEICIACIGTDRSTGDALGPLVGEKLKGMGGVKVVGNLKDPLHAKTLPDFIDTIKDNQLVIAVDASLGSIENVGSVRVSSGPIRPGAGLKKELPQIGDISIAGVVNSEGFMDFLVLGSTRLSLVMDMAEVIADAIKQGLSQMEYIGKEVAIQ
jgi:putative sporulation protein YyaC